jgi:hypothetical protein
MTLGLPVYVFLIGIALETLLATHDIREMDEMDLD